MRILMLYLLISFVYVTVPSQAMEDAQLKKVLECIASCEKYYFGRHLQGSGPLNDCKARCFKDLIPKTPELKIEVEEEKPKFFSDLVWPKE